MNKTINEAKKGGRLPGAGAPRGIRSSGSIDLGNIDAKPIASNLPSDRGIRDHIRLRWLFTTAFKLIHRHGKGGELENMLTKGLNYLNRLQSASRILSNPKKYGADETDINIYRRDAAENKAQIIELYSDIEMFLGKLIRNVVAQIYLKASDKDKRAIATLKDLQDLPQLETIKDDEAEIIHDIFFKRGVKATPEEVRKRVEELVNSFMKLDKEVMEDLSQVHNILTRLKTVSKTAKIEKDIITKSSKRAQNFNDPNAGYKRSNVDIADKRKITAAFASNDLDRARAELSKSGRDDLAKQVGRRTEGEIMRSFISGRPLSESFTFSYDILAENLLRRYKR